MLDATRVEDAFQIGKIAAYQFDAWQVGRNGRVDIDGQQAAGTGSLELEMSRNGARVSAAPKGGIDVDPARQWMERLHRGLE